MIPPHEPALAMDGPLSLSLSPFKGERVPKAGEGAVRGFKARIRSGNSLLVFEIEPRESCQRKQVEHRERRDHDPGPGQVGSECREEFSDRVRLEDVVESDIRFQPKPAQDDCRAESQRQNLLVGQAFQPAGGRGFPAPRRCPGDWKVAGTGRLESLPYAAFCEAKHHQGE